MMIDQFGQPVLNNENSDFKNPKFKVPLKAKGVVPNKAYVWDAWDQVVTLKTAGNKPEVVWDPRLFLKDGDGRLPLKATGQKIPSDDRDKIQTLFLTGFARSAEMMTSKDDVEKFYVNSLYDVVLACEGVDDLVLKSGQTLGAVATAAKLRLQKQFPVRFKSSQQNSVKK